MIGFNAPGHCSGFARLVLALTTICSSAALSVEARSVAAFGAATEAGPQRPGPAPLVRVSQPLRHR